MKASECMIAWNPTWWDGEESGKIEVGPWPDRSGWSDRYRMTIGACFSERHKFTPLEWALMVFVDFNTLVAGGMIAPDAAHRAFLKIDEYRDHVSLELPGTRDIQ